MKLNGRRHLRKRLLYFGLGMVLFTAPFALVLGAMGYAASWMGLGVGSAAAQSEATIHRAMCLRMPLIWAVWDQGGFLTRVVGNPLYALVFLLVGVSVFAGPLFCGWLCPGGMTEHLSRLIPARFKVDFKGSIDPAPIRYGFLAGFVLVGAPFIDKSICCGYCNWTWIEDAWNALFLRFDGVTGGSLFAYTSSSIITFLLTFLFLGIFMEGGRGWCNFLCPAGALQNLAHSIGAKFSFAYKLKFAGARCNDCFQCVKACPTWAIVPAENSIRINRHVCNGCTDCVTVCKPGALVYARGKQWENESRT
jgi:ferredoxin-type protein NapH